MSYYCNKCKGVHRLKSDIGKEHSYLQENIIIEPEINLNYGDFLYTTKFNAVNSFKYMTKPQNNVLLKRGKSFLVTTRRRSTMFKKVGWKLIGNGTFKRTGLFGIELPFSEIKKK